MTIILELSLEDINDIGRHSDKHVQDQLIDQLSPEEVARCMKLEIERACNVINTHGSN